MLRFHLPHLPSINNPIASHVQASVTIADPSCIPPERAGRHHHGKAREARSCLGGSRQVSFAICNVTEGPANEAMMQDYGGSLSLIAAIAVADSTSYRANCS